MHLIWHFHVIIEVSAQIWVFLKICLKSRLVRHTLCETLVSLFFLLLENALSSERQTSCVVGSPKFFFCVVKKIMFGTNTLDVRFRH